MSGYFPMTSKSRSNPRISDIKRLFARSGNRCAFPKCSSSIADGDNLLGEICHIKSVKPGGPRFDQDQTQEKRNGYDNLILLCPNHHKVIDDDEESYTVERLKKMKITQEAVAATLPETEVNHVTQLFIDQSVSNQNQSGGLTAHTVNADAINIQTSHVDTTTSARKIQAIENVWSAICQLKNNFGDLLFVDGILTADELETFFSSREDRPIYQSIRIYKDENSILRKLKVALELAEKERPFISDRLYMIFFAIQVVCGRTAMLLNVSFNKGSYQDWRKDTPIEQYLKSILPPQTVTALMQYRFGGLYAIISELEKTFTAEVSRKN
jgi:hypothetical protein